MIEKQGQAKTLIAATYVEQWTINKSVHFNEWENFASSEFQEVVAAYQALLDHMRCSNAKCASLPYLMPRKGSSEQLRCNCQTINVNLKTK